MKDLAMHILDILQNSLRANATKIDLDIDEVTTANQLIIAVSDNGKGMSEEVCEKVTDPFYTSRTTRKVGLGLPLLKQNAEQTGGSLRIESEEGLGTRVTATFILNHIDRPEMGDIAGALVLTITANPDIEFSYRHRKDMQSYTFNTREIKGALGDLPLNDPHVYPLLLEMVRENLKEIHVDCTT
ncbi:MAG: ATP-binding protein [Bacteroidales bacterium]|nr:ATP-binding protein [Bacteroidales bacterium]